MSLASKWAVYLAIFLPAALYLIRSWFIRKQVKGIEDFFPLKRQLSTPQYRSTTVAAGMSLATVMIYFLNLAPFLGMALFVSVVSFCASIVFLYFLIPKIMDANPDNLTVQSFLGNTYQSTSVKKCALFFSLIGYLSIFSMELLVGVSILAPFFGNKVVLFASLYLGFLLIYALMSGYKAIVATDRLQLAFIVLSILGLLGYLLYLNREPGFLDLAAFKGRLRSAWAAPLSFYLGITFLNLPAPVSDAGTWQRVCSCKDSKTAQKGLVGVFFLFILLWSALILLGNAFSVSSIPTQFADMPMISGIIASMGQIESVAGGLIVLVFMLGLFSAMVSTADSLLIAAGQVFVIDVLKVSRKDEASTALKKSRLAMLVLALGSFLLFVVFQFLKLDVVNLVFAIYGAQLAMVPAVFTGLISKKLRADPARGRLAALLSITIGFAAAWASALYGKFAGNLLFLYNAPVFGFGLATLVYLGVYWIRNGIISKKHN